ncbi:MarR family transcriptional regulator [Streptomyces sp. NPDC056178]|uniref:LexA family protein n=1 Tax=unclassified Streptomyces TaxID=2593676 RepID=UPI0034252FE9
MTEITDRQQRILRAIREHIADRGEAPTVREIGEQVGLSSPSSVSYQLGRLEAMGVIRRSRRGRRSVRLSR